MFKQRLAYLAAAGLLLLATGFVPTPAATTQGYVPTNLVSNQAGKAKNQDTSLVNAWGIAFAPTGPFWVSDNGTGVSTLYNAAGVKQSLVVTVPPAPGGTKGSPTGIVFNGSVTDFMVSQNGKAGAAAFIFDTSDGTISGWNPTVNPTTAVIVVNNSASGTSYTGLAIGSNNGANFIFAVDAAGAKVDIYNSTFGLVSSFTDPNPPAGSSPYGIQNIGGQLFVTFSGSGSTGNFVDIFDTAGNFVKRFATGGTLNAPWGLAQAPAKVFGPFSGAILVSNLADGKINAFNATTGKFLGQLKNTAGKTLVISDLWGLAFGGGTTVNGKTNQLFFTAGPQGYANGLFGVINFK